ncbi:zinc ABC transporter substrate-binding protein, partial [candidate division KSB1 bacterium]|nr:zinc ABC transporter substrate-binding protein [candidate division KSB1 bacterium]
VAVESISAGNQEAHFVQPKPSYALKMNKADLFITTGLDLELWVPALLDKARNRNIMEGAIGYVSAATDVPMLEKPETNPDRALGDVHIYGNPHIHTSPVNAKIIAENILVGLKKVAPEHSVTFTANYAAFCDRIDRSLFGEELVGILGGEMLSKMLLSGTLFEFLQTKEYGGEKLIDKLGGWLQEALPLRGRKVICYHKDWSYFTRDFGLAVVDYIEPKPGIPPTTKHVKEMIDKITSQKLQVLIVANYYEKNTPNMIAARTGIKAVFIPLDVGGEPGVNTYFDLIDYWIDKLNEAFAVQTGLKD